MKATRLFIFLLLVCLVSKTVISQQIESNSNRERNFAFEIKHIDEFIERFNDDHNAFIIKYVNRNYPGTIVDRKSLITNLFNRKTKWNTSDLDNFLTQVNDVQSPTYLDFDSDQWYAETVSKFRYKGEMIDVKILLKIQQAANGGTKWMIVSASSNSIAPCGNQLNIFKKIDVSKYLNPMSHATNFISLNKALNDKPGIINYLDTNFLKTSNCRAFLKALLSNQLQYQYVKNITYHFLQVNGWIFTVNRFERSSINSGWLISKIRKASDQEKEDYKNLLISRKKA